MLISRLYRPPRLSKSPIFPIMVPYSSLICILSAVITLRICEVATPSSIIATRWPLRLPCRWSCIICARGVIWKKYTLSSHWWKCCHSSFHAGRRGSQACKPCLMIAGNQHIAQFAVSQQARHAYRVERLGMMYSSVCFELYRNSMKYITGS